MVLLASLLQPSADRQVVVYLVSVVGLTTLGLPLVLSFQTTVPLQPVTESVADVPKQMSVVLAEIVGGAGFELTSRFTLLLIMLSQPVGNKQVAE